MARWFARGTIGMTLAGAILISGCSIQDTSASGREAAASVDARAVHLSALNYRGVITASHRIGECRSDPRLDGR